MAANSQVFFFFLMDDGDVSDPSFFSVLRGKTGGTGLHGEDKDGNRDRTGGEGGRVDGGMGTSQRTG